VALSIRAQSFHDPLEQSVLDLSHNPSPVMRKVCTQRMTGVSIFKKMRMPTFNAIHRSSLAWWVPSRLKVAYSVTRLWAIIIVRKRLSTPAMWPCSLSFLSLQMKKRVWPGTAQLRYSLGGNKNLRKKPGENVTGGAGTRQPLLGLGERQGDQECPYMFGSEQSSLSNLALEVGSDHKRQLSRCGGKSERRQLIF